MSSLYTTSTTVLSDIACTCFALILVILAMISNCNLNTDVNECTSGNGGCEGTCTNVEGSFHCSCPPQGFTLSPDGRGCDGEIDQIFQ